MFYRSFSVFKNISPVKTPPVFSYGTDMLQISHTDFSSGKSAAYYSSSDVDVTSEI